MIPDLLGMFWREINFETVFAGVAGARNHAMHSINVTKSEMIVADGLELNWREALEQMLSQRALNGQQGIAVAIIFHLRPYDCWCECGKIVYLISRVHYQEIVAIEIR